MKWRKRNVTVKARMLLRMCPVSLGAAPISRSPSCFAATVILDSIYKWMCMACSGSHDLDSLYLHVRLWFHVPIPMPCSPKSSSLVSAAAFLWVPRASPASDLQETCCHARDVGFYIDESCGRGFHQPFTIQLPRKSCDIFGLRPHHQNIQLPG